MFYIISIFPFVLFHTFHEFIITFDEIITIEQLVQIDIALERQRLPTIALYSILINKL